MGVFGVQLVCTMVMSSVLSKVVPHWSPARWLLCRTGLSYYLHPTNDQLRGDSAKKKSTSSKKSPDNDDETFNVLPKNIDVNLTKAVITETDVLQLRFFSDYQWLVDFSFCSLIVYLITEMYLNLNPGKDEVNLSMVWCLLLLIFAVKTLFSVTLVYFKSTAGDGEKALVVLALFSYLLLAMVLLVISEEKLELGLDEAYSAFNVSATEFMKTQDITSVGMVSKMGCKGVVAVLCAITGSCLAFPGLRLGKMHWDAVRQHESRRLVQLLLNVAFIAPAIVSLLWVRPLARHYLVQLTWPSYDRPLLSTECFSIVRVIAVLVACALRLLVLPWYLQAYLEMAKVRLEQQRSHAGKINNKEIQRQVASVFYYLCVVTLQYLLPLLLSCVLAIMLKTLGGLHWAALLEPRSFVSEECGVDEEQLLVGAGLRSPLARAALSSLAASTETTQALSSGFDSLRKVMVPEMWRGLLGFWAWWSMFAWFLSGLLGLLYQKYFTVG